MQKHWLAFIIVYAGFSAGTAYAQECRHGSGESAGQAARRREALTATRCIDNIQANQPGNSIRQYLRYDQLESSPYAFRMRESTNETIKKISLIPGTDVL